VLLVRQEDLDELGVGAWEVRANISIAGLDPSSLESGRVLEVGSSRIRMTHLCEVCSVLRQYVSRDVFRRLPRRRGSLGVILAGGQISIGDPVLLTEERYPTVPEQIFERLAWVLAQIPSGQVTDYGSLMTLIGGSRSYFRVLPSYLRRAVGEGLPAHRVLNSRGVLIEQHLGGQGALLLREGHKIGADGTVETRGRSWSGAELYYSSLEAASRAEPRTHARAA
jgi:methylated-DNA-protein-cysteine methyltransferase-like protein